MCDTAAKQHCRRHAGPSRRRSDGVAWRRGLPSAPTSWHRANSRRGRNRRARGGRSARARRGPGCPAGSRPHRAARREERGSSIWSNIARSFAAGRASKLGSSNIGGAGGATGGDVSLRIEALRLVSAAVSLMFRASWIAESASSVGSLTFFGVFAMFSPSPRYLYASPASSARYASPQSGSCRLRGSPSHPHPDGLSANFSNILLAERRE